MTLEFGAGSAGVEGRGCPEEEEKEGFGDADSILFLSLHTVRYVSNYEKIHSPLPPKP